MEPDPASRLTGRQQRAVGLIAISLLAIVVACSAYVIPSLHLGEAAKDHHGPSAAITPAELPHDVRIHGRCHE